MIPLNDLVSELAKNDVNFATGVPDSLIGQIGDALDSAQSGISHLTAVNEGSAIGLAIGSYLATGKLPAVYMQNSGLGNALNPLVSLGGSSAFHVPILLLIGWRGEIGLDGIQILDEPQHMFQGAITTSLLDQLDIPFLILDSTSRLEEIIRVASQTAVQNSLPFAILIRKDSFVKSSFPRNGNEKSISRRRAIEVVCDATETSVPIIATTGMISRELFDVRRNSGQVPTDLLCVGGMGHAVSIASGFASMKDGPVVLLDGDGAAQMHLGAQLTAASTTNLIHIILNNGAHASVGGQKTSAPNLNFSDLAPHLGYVNACLANTEFDIRTSISAALSMGTSTLIEIKCALAATPELGRPNEHPSVNARVFREKASKSR